MQFYPKNIFSPNLAVRPQSLHFFLIRTLYKWTSWNKSKWIIPKASHRYQDIKRYRDIFKFDWLVTYELEKLDEDKDNEKGTAKSFRAARKSRESHQESNPKKWTVLEKLAI